MPAPTRILLIDDHSLFREAIARLLGGESDFELAGDCYRPGDFLSCLRDGWLAAQSVEHRFRGATAVNAGKQEVA